MTNKSKLHGAELSPITSDTAEKLFAWLINKGSAPIDSFNPKWAVIQCADTFIWGIYDSDGWKLASDIDPDIRPPKAKTFIEARIFNENEEALLWQDSKGFHGRSLKNKECANGVSPLDREAAFDENKDHTTREELSGGFIKRINPGGRILVTPQGKALCIKEYLAEDECGILRIAATRFCKFSVDDRNE